jgi:hypothetical protein
VAAFNLTARRKFRFIATRVCRTLPYDPILLRTSGFLSYTSGGRSTSPNYLGFCFLPFHVAALGGVPAIRAPCCRPRAQQQCEFEPELRATRITTREQAMHIAQDRPRADFYPKRPRHAKRMLAATRTTGQTWDVVPTRARSHTVRDWQRAVDKVVVCRPSRSPGRDPFWVRVAPLLLIVSVEFAVWATWIVQCGAGTQVTSGPPSPALTCLPQIIYDAIVGAIVGLNRFPRI